MIYQLVGGAVLLAVFVLWVLGFWSRDDEDDTRPVKGGISPRRARELAIIADRERHPAENGEHDGVVRPASRAADRLSAVVGPKAAPVRCGRCGRELRVGDFPYCKGDPQHHDRRRSC